MWPKLNAKVPFAAVVACCLLTAAPAVADTSPAPILQWFDASFETMIDRTPDLFTSGYGSVWIPPPGRAGGDGLGGLSVGYDPYDRYDLGSPGRPTMYGTETGIKTVASLFHRAAADLHVDYIINHNGTNDLSSVDGDGHSFLDAGGYPGFLLTHPQAIDGDFHSRFAGGDQDGRLGGLIDIDHGRNFRYVRHPVPGVEPIPGDHGGNLSAGTTEAFGRLANVPRESNRRFYPTVGHNTMYVFDPVTGEQDIPVHQFNLDDPMAGDPVGENAMGFLMRYSRWMVQVIGIDGFRIDAARHVEGWALDFFDRGVYRSSLRAHLDGSPKHVFSYCEAASGDQGYVQTFVKKSIDPAEPGRIGGNRDALDFPLFFALRDNLTSNGLVNNWYNVVNAGIDVHDDRMHNGSQGVLFTHSHDDFGPALGNVAYAYTLMHPGNALVYFNGKEFGDQREFPKPGRGDALGGVYGETLQRLVEIRNTHGRGDYRERWLEKENFAYERSNSALVLLSNRLDAGYDQRRVDVDFAWGTTLVELTANAAADGNVPELVTVDNDYYEGPSKVTVRFLRNGGGDRGYLVYGLAPPQAAWGVGLTNVAEVLPGGMPAANDYANGVTRLADLHVVTEDDFNVCLTTQPVTLTGTRLEDGQLVERSIRDHDADGDNALLRIDEGRDLNGNGYVDHVTPNTVTYGFEQFADQCLPGYFANGGAGGNGCYRQTIDATQLEEGVHFITIRAFRHRTDGGPAIFSDFKKVVYLDRLKPLSGIRELTPVNDPASGDRDVFVESLDLTAAGVHVFVNLPESVSDAEILSLAGQGQGATQRIDVDLFKGYFPGLGTGNNVFTLVTFEPIGNSNVQRVAGQWVDGRGAGLGDLNHDGLCRPDDLASSDYGFEHVLYTRNTEFHPAADVNADGRVDNLDLFALPAVLADAGVPEDTLQTCHRVLLRRADFTGDSTTDQRDIDELYRRFGSAEWYDDLNVDGTTGQDDVDVLIRTILGTQYGDANLDLDVNIDDLQVLHDHWQQPSGWAGGDFTGDQVADDADLGLIELYWNSPRDYHQAYHFAFGAPEPSSATLLAVGSLLGVLLLRRRHNSRPRPPQVSSNSVPGSGTT